MEAQNDFIDEREYDEFCSEMAFHNALVEAERMAISYPRDLRWSEACEFLKRYARVEVTA